MHLAIHLYVCILRVLCSWDSKDILVPVVRLSCGAFVTLLRCVLISCPCVLCIRWVLETRPTTEIDYLAAGKISRLFEECVAEACVPSGGVFVFACTLRHGPFHPVQ